MKEEINEDMVELVERYATALQEIKELVNDDIWGEDDVEMAERYAEALKEIDKSDAVVKQ